MILPNTRTVLMFYLKIANNSYNNFHFSKNLSSVFSLYPEFPGKDALANIGSKDAKRGFFKEYYRFLERTDSKADGSACGIEDGILIDSSGLPNSIRLPLTAVNTHNGIVSEEIRLIMSYNGQACHCFSGMFQETSLMSAH